MESSGGDEPRIHIGVAGASCYEDHQVTPKSALGVVLSVKKLWWIHNSDASRLSINNLGRPGSAKQIPPIHPLSAIWNRARTRGKCLCEERIKDRKVLRKKGLITGFAPRVTSYGQPTALIPPEASPHKRELKCDTTHQSQEADATFITSDGS